MLRKVTLVAKMSDATSFEEGPYIGVDRGALLLAMEGVRMIAAIGDFDSVDVRELELIKEYCDEFVLLPREKDQTDSEAAIQYAIHHGYDEISLLGGMYGRSDHFLANVMLVYRYKGIVTMQDRSNKILYLGKGMHYIEREEYDYLSFMAFEECELSLEGVKYPLSHQVIDLGDVYTISNEICEQQATVSIYRGHVLLIQSRD